MQTNPVRITSNPLKLREPGNFKVCRKTPRGRNASSPAITYINMGDTYTVTMLKVRGRVKIGAWGDIVERGNYE